MAITLFDEDDFKRLAQYFSELTKSDASALHRSVAYDLQLGESTEPHAHLVNGLTTLYRACWDITDLLRTADASSERTHRLELVVLGLLFEIHRRIDIWVARPTRKFYESRGRDPGMILARGRPVGKLFKTHMTGLKAIRNRIFHLHWWPVDEAISEVARAMYARRVPGTLHKALIDYGVATVEMLCEDGIGIPGIGCFGVICIPGREVENKTYEQLFHPYWPSEDTA